MDIKVVMGDLLDQSGVLLVPINNVVASWPGGVDMAFMSRVGVVFHQQIADQINAGEFVQNGQALWLDSPEGQSYQAVLWVMDNLWTDPETDLSKILLPALAELDRRQVENISLPVMRTGAAQRVFGSPEVQEEQLMKVLKGWAGVYPKTATVVVFGDEIQLARLVVLNQKL